MWLRQLSKVPQQVRQAVRNTGPMIASIGYERHVPFGPRNHHAHLSKCTAMRVSALSPSGDIGGTRRRLSANTRPHPPTTRTTCAGSWRHAVQCCPLDYTRGNHNVRHPHTLLSGADSLAMALAIPDEALTTLWGGIEHTYAHQPEIVMCQGTSTIV